MLKSKPEVYIIESLGLDDEAHLKEGEIISRTLKLSGKMPIYRYIRTTKELEYFTNDFVKSNYRYLHISSHGNNNLISLTFNNLDNNGFARIVANALNRKRLFLSSCGATTVELASKIFEGGTCVSIAGPARAIYFDDAAIFWSAFYHLMFKKEANRMRSKDVRAGMSVFGTALAEQFKYFGRKKDGTLITRVLPPDSVLNERIEELISSEI